MRDFPERIIRLAELTEFTGLRRSQLGVLIERGEFPRPVYLSERRKGWLAREVADWQAKRIAQRGVVKPRPLSRRDDGEVVG